MFSRLQPLCVLAGASIIISIVSGECPDCNDVSCPTESDSFCPHGIVYDVCGCCRMCARGPGERCHVYGHPCARGLRCRQVKKLNKPDESFNFINEDLTDDPFGTEKQISYTVDGIFPVGSLDGKSMQQFDRMMPIDPFEMEEQVEDMLGLFKILLPNMQTGLKAGEFEVWTPKSDHKESEGNPKSAIETESKKTARKSASRSRKEYHKLPLPQHTLSKHHTMWHKTDEDKHHHGKMSTQTPSTTPREIPTNSTLGSTAKETTMPQAASEHGTSTTQGLDVPRRQISGTESTTKPHTKKTPKVEPKTDSPLANKVEQIDTKNIVIQKPEKIIPETTTIITHSEVKSKGTPSKDIATQENMKRINSILSTVENTLVRNKRGFLPSNKPQFNTLPQPLADDESATIYEILNPQKSEHATLGAQIDSPLKYIHAISKPFAQSSTLHSTIFHKLAKPTISMKVGVPNSAASYKVQFAKPSSPFAQYKHHSTTDNNDIYHGVCSY